MNEQEERPDPGNEPDPSNAPDPGNDPGEGAGPVSAEERMARYRALVEDEFQDLFAAHTQQLIDQRLRELQAAQEARQAQLLEETARRAAEERERALIQNILAQGARPAENGAGTQNGLAARPDPARMTPAQRADIAQRAARGETITFR